MIELRNVSKTVASGSEMLTILQPLDLFVSAGKFLSVVGPSGSGKSTLLGLVAGLDAPTSGGIIVDGVDITALSEDELAKLRNLQRNHRDKLKSISIPLLTIHGDKDAVVPLERAFELHDMVASEVKVLDIIPNVGHNTIFLYGMETYMQSLESFINKV